MIIGHSASGSPIFGYSQCGECSSLRKENELISSKNRELISSAKEVIAWLIENKHLHPDHPNDCGCELSNLKRLVDGEKERP
jgi:hypothetical protein